MAHSGTVSVPAEEISAAAPFPPRFRWLKRFSIGLFALLIGITAFHFLWDYRSRQLWNAYIAERRAAGEPMLPEDLTSRDVPDDENAALLLTDIGLRANTLVNSGDVGIWSLNADLSSIRAFQAAAHAELSAAGDLLCRLHTIRDKLGTDWQVRARSPMIGTLLPMLSPLRANARLCAFAAVTEHDRCNDGQAVENVILGLDVASRARNGELFLIGYLVAQACESLMVEAIAQIQPALLIDEAGEDGAAARARVRHLIEWLLDEHGTRAQFRRAIFSERACILDTFECIATSKLPPGFLSMPNPRVLTPILPAWRMGCILVARRLETLAAALDEPTLAAARSRLPAKLALSESSIGWVFDRVSVYLEPDLSEAVRMHYHLLAMRRMAATALAMRLFELDCGRPPESLAELVPDYLLAVPLDPMDGDGRRIGYVRTEDLPRLYSIGSDGIDEAGRIDWTSGFPESPRQEEILFFLTDRPRPMRNDLYYLLLKLDQIPPSGNANSETTGSGTDDAGNVAEPAGEEVPENSPDGQRPGDRS